jgi:hypothetical protein
MMHSVFVGLAEQRQLESEQSHHKENFDFSTHFQSDLIIFVVFVVGSIG